MTFVHGDVGDRAAAEAALAGVDRVVHLAAAVGVGQSMYEIARYVHQNTYATAVFLECVLRALAAAAAARRRLVDVDLRRGRVRVPRARPAVAAARAPRRSCSRATGSVVCAACGRPLEPVGTPETKPLIPTSIYAIDQARPRGAVPRRRRRLRHPDRRPALLQRLRPGPGALEPLHGRCGDLRVAPAERATRRSSSRTGASRATSSTSATSSQGSCWRSSPRRPSARRSTSAPGARSTVADVAAALARRARRRASSRRSPRQYRAGDIRHCYADPALAERAPRLRARRSTLEDGMRDLVDVAAGPEGGRPGRRSATRRARRPRPRALRRRPCTTSRSSSSPRTRRTGCGPASRRVFEHARRSPLDVVVADNASTDGTRELVEREFPRARAS